VSGEDGAVTPAFDAVYESERLEVTRLAYLLVRSRPAAEGLAQEAFVRLYQRFDAVEDPPWFLRTVVVRLAVAALRRRDTERRRPPRLVGVPAPLGEPEVDETLAALSRLRPERRALLVLRFYEDLDDERIAARLGCSAATVRGRVRRALADLRKESSA
jgi:RNA polymerase sigma factor (sigma-70 family)